MMRTIQIDEAKTSFSTLLAAVEAGEEIAITRYGQVMVRMVPGARRLTTPSPHPRWGETKTALEAHLCIDTELLAPLD